MISYKCKVYKYLWQNTEMSELWACLSRTLEIPFVPTAGIELREGDWFTGRIGRVIWDNAGHRFALEDTEEIIAEEDAKAVVDHHLCIGWQIERNNTK